MDTSHRSIAVAIPHPIYQQHDVEQAIADTPPESESLLRLYEKMIMRGGDRYLVRPSSEHCLDAFAINFPNFHSVIEMLQGDILLSQMGQGAMHFTPILLLGEPGVGKTRFARTLAQLLGTNHQLVSMGSVTAGWILGGSAAGWKSAKQGKIADVLINGESANPVVLLDELDKAAGSHEYDPLGPLFTLLERNTAGKFIDEFVNVPIDASHILWVATANYSDLISKPILDRMDVHVIPNLTKEETVIVAQNIYREILDEHHWNFVPELSLDILSELSVISPRTINRVLNTAFRRAVNARRDHLTMTDVKNSLTLNEKKVGF